MCMDVSEYDKHLFWINICRLNVSLDSPARPRNSCAFLEWLTLSLLCASMLAGSWDAYGVRNHSFSMGISHEKNIQLLGIPHKNGNHHIELLWIYQLSEHFSWEDLHWNLDGGGFNKNFLGGFRFQASPIGFPSDKLICVRCIETQNGGEGN